MERDSAQHRALFWGRSTALQWGTILVSGAAVLAVYVLTLAPAVTAGDAGELITAAHMQGVAHPPGYPLWCLGAWLFSHLVPIGSVAYRMNLFSAFFGALSASVCTATLLRLGCRRAVAAAAGVCMGLSKELWTESVVAEVYSMNLFFVGLLILVFLKWQHDPKPGRLVLFAGLLGLGMGNHHTLLAVGVVGAVWAAWRQPSLLRNGPLWLKALGAFFTGLLVYVYLPLAASAGGYMNWGDPSTPERFWAHLTRAQYPSDMEKPRSLVRTVGQLGWVTGKAAEQFTPALVPVILLGLWWSRKSRALLPLTGGVFLAFAVGFTLLSNFEFQRENLEVVRVFYLPAYYVMALWLGLGLEQLARWAQSVAERLGATDVDPLLPYAPLVLLPGLLIWSHGSENDFSNYYYAEDHAHNVLATLEEHAIIFPSGDHNTFPLMYLQAVEGQRRDVTVADKYGFVEESLYRAMPDPPKNQPSAQERRGIEDWIIANTTRPVYFTVKRSMAGLPGYELRQAGLLYRVVRPGESFEPGDLWSQYQYRNLQRPVAALDYGAAQVLFDYYFQRGMWHLERGQKRRGLEALAQAERHGLWIKESYNNIASALAEHGLARESLDYYRRAIAIDPRYENARWNLAKLYQNLGGLNEAIEQYEALAEIDAKDPRPFGQIGFLYRALQNRDKAMAYWHKSLRRYPEQPQIIEAIAEMQAEDLPAEPQEQLTVAIAEPEVPVEAEPAEAAPNGPRLDLAKTSHDFGRVVEGTEPRHVFDLVNIGTEPLEITDVATSCRCTAAIPSKATIPSGEKMALTVSLKTGGRPGEESQKVTFRTNDPQQPNVTLRVHAEVLRQLQLVPQSADLGRLRPGEMRQAVTALVVRSQGDLEIQEVSVEPPVANAVIHDPITDEDTVRRAIDLTVAEGVRGGPLRGRLVVRTNHPRYSQLEMQLFGYIQDVVDCKPRRVFFGTVKSGGEDAAEKEVQVSCKEVERLEITAASSSEHVAVEVAPADDPQHVRLLVRLKDAPPRGYFSASVELKTNVDAMRRLTIPVGALVR